MGLSADDDAYIRANFVPLDELCDAQGVDPAETRRLVAAGRLPHPSYVLDAGTEMVPRDYFDLAEAAGGVEHLREMFLQRYRAAAGPGSTPAEEEWEAYLTGAYGVCLNRVSPETIVHKEMLVKRTEALLSSPFPQESEWRKELRESVDDLDRLERPFAQYDRERFGEPTSRDRCITAARERYPDVFATAATRQ
jgi:hypothetical protein